MPPPEVCLAYYRFLHTTTESAHWHKTCVSTTLPIGICLAQKIYHNHPLEVCTKTTRAILLINVITHLRIWSPLIYSPVSGNPSCLQTTWALTSSQRSSQTVPHSPLWQISTRPSFAAPPLTNLMSPSAQSASVYESIEYQCISNASESTFYLRNWHLTPTSSLWKQLCDPIPLWRQSVKRDSFPRHLTLSRNIAPIATPNPASVALVNATAPFVIISCIINSFNI